MNRNTATMTVGQITSASSDLVASLDEQEHQPHGEKTKERHPRKPDCEIHLRLRQVKDQCELRLEQSSCRHRTDRRSFFSSRDCDPKLTWPRPSDIALCTIANCSLHDRERQ
jgi:hypothetical protein